MRTNTFILGLMVALVVAIGLLVACGGPTPTQTREPPQEEQPTAQPTEAPQEEQPTAQPPLGDGGEALLQQTCTKCHSLDRIQRAQKTREEWEQTYERMMAKGAPAAPVSEDELDILIEYLTETYGL